MRNPPQLPTLLLHYASGDYAKYVVGDLTAEYLERSEVGERAASRWYWRQSFESLAPLLAARFRRENWQAAVLWAILASAVPTLVMDFGWSMVLSEIPLKAGLVRSPEFLAVSLLVNAAFFASLGVVCSGIRLMAAFPVAVLFFLLAHTASRGLTPAWFPAASICVFVLATLAGYRTRRISTV